MEANTGELYKHYDYNLKGTINKELGEKTLKILKLLNFKLLP